MNILIVTGHPKKESHTKQIADTYKEEVEKLGHSTQMLNVYADEFRLPYMTYEKDSLNEDDHKKIIKMQEMITWAGEIVIIHPIWWAAMPAGLKNWADAMFAPHFAFQYNEKGHAVPMLQGKIAKVFATAGSYAFYYRWPIISYFTPIHIIWKYAILGFSGIELVEIKVRDRMNVNNNCPPVGCFEAFLKVIKKSAKHH
jgi:putative NADPH-quinone reductase